MSAYQHILDQLPYSEPFLFVDGLTHLDDEGAEGYFTFSEKLDFYRGHFVHHPITPGVILTETMAQIGLVCLGLHLLNSKVGDVLEVAFAAADVSFLKPVFPGETVRVVSKKQYFRFNKLKCAVELFNASGEVACRGVLAGMIKKTDNG